MQTPSSTCPRCQSPIPADAPGGICPSCALLGVAEPTNPSQAAAAHAPTIDEVAAAFPELEVLELIGQGGMGVVFKARQPRLDRLVALKILPLALAAQPGFAERFTREARVLARLAHPHIVAIYDFGESAGFFYLIMEFVNGVNLRAAMRAGVKPEQALLLVPHICEALQFAHDHGVLHRDIKPENILLDTTGTPKLADFGIAKLAGEEITKTGLTATGAALGTVAYMSPEQIEKPATVDHRADIYSLGVVLYEMLTGELPLGRFAAPSEKSHVSPGVDEVVMRSLEKERERRQQSAAEMKTQVEGASQSGLRPAVAAPSQPSPAALAMRIFILLTVASAVGIPISGILRWTTPAPGQMVALTLLFGALAGLAKVFAPLPANSAGRHQDASAGAPPADGLNEGWQIRCANCGRAARLADIGGIRIGAASIGKRTVIRCSECGGLREGIIERVGASPLAHYPALPPAANPWPNRLFWLVAAVFVLPTVAIFCGLLAPRLSMIGNDLGGRPSGWLIALVALLPFLAGAALYFGYRRTRPGVDRATPRETWNPWPMRIFLLILAVVVAPVLLLGFGLALPLLVAYQSLERPAPPQVSQLQQASEQAKPVAIVTAERAPFIGELSQGSIELVAITRHPSAGQPWWGMNGEPSREGPFLNQGQSVIPKLGEDTFEFVFRTKGLPSDASRLFWEIPGQSSGGARPGLAAQRTTALLDYDLVAASLPREARETQIRAGVARGAWQSLFGRLPGNSAVRSASLENVKWTLTLGTVGESNGSEAMATYSFSENPGWVQRMVAITHGGEEIAPSYSSTIGRQSEVRFAHLPIKTVAEFCFQVRRIEWVEFRGVQLSPATPKQ